MTWHAAMRWGRILSRSCRIIYTDAAGHLEPGHRHLIKGYRPVIGDQPGPWAYSVHCTNAPAPTK